ncbi:tyrosine-type recombinase/integrase [Nucisporomicrobium flavum]|uniref:tyrosine-type recombinase/integrase n=1 Tax=Nucisporomicrobium flavum TaxID=2785915 RepID=UPI001F2FB194|nr:site-specific integrase [Nucisporomicrobium flavum]
MSQPDINSTNIALVTALMAQLNITTDQLTGKAPHTPRPVPTFAEYIPHVAAGLSASTRRLYDTYWQRILAQWGSRHLDELKPSEIRHLAEEARAHAVIRRSHRGGASAAEHLIAALRCIYRYAVDDRLISPDHNPAARVPKPRRQQSLRQALPEPALSAIFTVTRETGNDPDLDLLILRLHLETACRRAGALSIRRQDLDTQQCLVLLHEKGQTQRWQPISPTLNAALITHFDHRGDGNPTSQLLRYRNGRPVGRRRYDYLWQRIGKHLPWVASQQVSAHWLRHTTLTWVERHISYATARAFAGHASAGDGGTTATYVKATLQEVAQALAALTGEPHPLAETDRTHAGSRAGHWSNTLVQAHRVEAHQ